MNVNVKDTILKPIDEVWDAIKNPDKITGYFVSGVNGKILEGETIKWEFADYCVTLDVFVRKITPQSLFSFQWEGNGKQTDVKIELSSESDTKTKIEITETEFDLTEVEIKRALEQTQGWTDFICSMKAYLYTGINLRNGKIKAV